MSRSAMWAFSWLAILSLATAAEPAADSCKAGATECDTTASPDDIDTVGLLQMKSSSVVHRELSGATSMRSQEGLTVACTWEHIAEDMNLGDPNVEEDDYHWGLCITSDDVAYNIIEDDTTEAFDSGDHVEIEVASANFQQPAAMKGDEVPLPEEAGEQFYKVVKVISRSPPEHASMMEEVTNSTAPKTMKMLLVFLDYNDKTPTYSDEADARKKIYGNGGTEMGSFAHLIKENSYGRLLAPESEGTFVRVKMGTNWVGTTKCPYRTFASEAVKKVREQHNIEPNDFVFRQFFIPSSPNGGCTWGGLANVGCGHYSKLGSRTCDAWYRTSSVFAWTHELGHNLGLSHASGERGGKFVEYGDPQASMGASYRFSSFTASARHQAGLLKDAKGEAGTWEPGMGSFTLQTLSRGLNCCGADYVGVRFSCPSCESEVKGKPKGGNIWVQFRGDEGYSSFKLSSSYQNKVYVHLHRKYSGTYGRGSELWAKLDAGGSYTIAAAGRTVYVCSIEGDVATVAIGNSLEDAKGQCSGGGGGGGDDNNDNGGGGGGGATTTTTTTTTTTRTTKTTTTKTPTNGCADKNGSCGFWKGKGYCTQSYVSYMKKTCALSCGYCSGGPTTTTTSTTTTKKPIEGCADKNKHCGSWKDRGYCTHSHVNYMKKYCPKSCDSCNEALVEHLAEHETPMPPMPKDD